MNVIQLLVLLTVTTAMACASSPVWGDTFYTASGGTIKKYTDTGVSSVFASGGGFLAVDSTGNVYAASGSTILKYTPSGSSSLFANIPSPYEPEGIALDHAGNLYVSLYNFTTNLIEKYTPAGVGSVLANVDPPGAITVDPSGNVFVTVGGQSAIEKITPAGVGSTFVNGSSNSLAGGFEDIVCDSQGNLYAAAFNGEGAGNRIVKYTPAGVGSSAIELGNEQANGLAIDSAGNFYVSIFNFGLTEKFTPDGGESTFANSALGHLAVQSVPEPASLYLAGLGLTAFALAALRSGRRRFESLMSKAELLIPALSRNERE